MLIGCIAYDNADDNFTVGGNAAAVLYNCVADDYGDVGDNGIEITSGSPLVYLIGCRVTNHAGSGDIGINCSSLTGLRLFTGYNYYENNDGDNVQGLSGTNYEIPLVDSESTSNVEDQSDTNQGYTQLSGSRDFNLRNDASQRRVAISVPTS